MFFLSVECLPAVTMVQGIIRTRGLLSCYPGASLYHPTPLMFTVRKLSKSKKQALQRYRYRTFPDYFSPGRLILFPSLIQCSGKIPCWQICRPVPTVGEYLKTQPLPSVRVTVVVPTVANLLRGKFYHRWLTANTGMLYQPVL